MTTSASDIENLCFNEKNIQKMELLLM